MEQRNNLSSFFKGISEVLTQPISLTGRPLSASEIREKRAARARKQWQHQLDGDDNSAPQVSHFTMHGTLTPGQSSPYSINGQDFKIDERTFSVGDLEVGKTATVKGFVDQDGAKHARSIIVHV
ncbi:MAG: hypothetical protein KDD42_09060 [Bdellovibrionales bacterium]|nr:hypothetical protein [Bdellovibrionales bacterium]